MSFVTALALGIALFVAAPALAHLLRRRRADEQPFAPTRLVPASPPQLRRRSALEDRALFGARALSVILLALLGATPFVNCSRLQLARQSGASVALAIVLDDSLSMRAPYLPEDLAAASEGRAASAESRFARAKKGALELMDGLAPGDAVALVLAGAPARVALASTVNVEAARDVLSELTPSDRGTDLDGAIALGRDLVKALPQIDKRVVVLSDLADGTDRAPLSGEGEVPLWFALPELESKGSDCALLRADRSLQRVRVRAVCGGGGGEGMPPAARGRSIEIRDAEGKVLVSAPLQEGIRAEDVSLDLPAGAAEARVASLTGFDAIPADDSVPVAAQPARLTVAVVSDPSARVETGGAPPVEQAFSALDLDLQLRPLPSVPDHEGELARLTALVIDDAPGLTPQVRRSLASWVEKGGSLLVALGPSSAAAPLGASFDPLVPGVLRWASSPVKGAEPSSAFLGPSAASFDDLAPEGRIELPAEALSGAETLVAWSDGAPLLARRPFGRGSVYVLTLPLSTAQSDLVLRPAFLALLDRFVDAATTRGGPSRVDVGQSFRFDGAKEARVAFLPPGEDPRPVDVSREGSRLLAPAAFAGLYQVDLDGEVSRRVATIPEAEIDLTPRGVQGSARASTLGGVKSSIDASPYVALALLGLLALELFLRSLHTRRAAPAT